jgi:hypothetical protein
MQATSQQHLPSHLAIDMSTPETDNAGSSSPKPVTKHQEQSKGNIKKSIRQRLKHFTFAWFLCTMSTGGLAIALGETPHQFNGTLHHVQAPSLLSEDYSKRRSMTDSSVRLILHRPFNFPLQHSPVLSPMRLHSSTSTMAPHALPPLLHRSQRIFLLR